jgi:hypothetical protein
MRAVLIARSLTEDLVPTRVDADNLDRLTKRICLFNVLTAGRTTSGRRGRLSSQ